MCVSPLHPARLRAAGRLTRTQVLRTGAIYLFSIPWMAILVCASPGMDISPLPWHTAHGNQRLFNKPLPDMRPPSTAGWTGGFY